jgi:uncharacterized protein
LIFTPLNRGKRKFEHRPNRPKMSAVDEGKKMIRMAKSCFAVMILATAATAAPTSPASAQSPASRPSFACGKSRSAVEHLICADVELGRLDRIIAELFAETRGLSLNSEQSAQGDADQRAWLAKRNRCTAVECLRQSYFKRIIELAQALPADA